MDIARFSALLSQRQASHTLPQDLYISDDSFAFDMDAIYRHAGGDNSPSTTRYSAASVFNPQNPRGGNTLDNEICDRVRWCGYLMTIGTPSFVSH